MSEFQRMEDNITPDAPVRSDSVVDRDAPGQRPTEVEGPFGKPITILDLPPSNTRRWVARRKAEVLAAIRGGLLTAAEACQRYRLSPEELDLWQDSVDCAGVPGLRVTRIQLYRRFPGPGAPPVAGAGSYAPSARSSHPHSR
jgi:hypothetical protein